MWLTTVVPYPTLFGPSNPNPRSDLVHNSELFSNLKKHAIFYVNHDETIVPRCILLNYWESNLNLKVGIRISLFCPKENH